MIAFEVKDMTCGHCVGAITRAIGAIDAQARVDIDLAQHRVHIAASDVGPEELGQAIRQAGYTPVPVTPP